MASTTTVDGGGMTPLKSSGSSALASPSAGGSGAGGGAEGEAGSVLDKIGSFGGVPSGASDDNAGGSGGAAFDPIEFLNHHYGTESALVSSLPSLRTTINGRISSLDESISNAIQRQADLAHDTANDVERARTAINHLHSRIHLVQNKARMSERAVLEITKDIKRLDCAKRHLSRTITALKRLHMLLHAVRQLRVAADASPHPDYRSAANLMDATRLLLGHFDGYMGSIPKLRDVRDAVGQLRLELRESIVLVFRTVGLGFTPAIQKSQRNTASDKAAEKLTKSNVLTPPPASKGPQRTPTPTPPPASETPQGRPAPSDDANEPPPPPQTSPQILGDACLVIEALGVPTRTEFIETFCQDHLDKYKELFDPSCAKDANASGAASTPAPKPSFKIMIPTTSNVGDSSADGADSSKSNLNASPSSLDQVERRYAWYRRLLRDLDSKFHKVFPDHWNMYYLLTFRFLTLTAQHFSLLLTPNGKHRDGDCENVTVLLKALQKTILFEKEMMAWMQRDLGVVFIGFELAQPQQQQSLKASNASPDNAAEEQLEFDEYGKAVPANSAEGIRIRYERKIRERRRKAAQGGQEEDDVNVEAQARRGDSPKERDPVRSLQGVASSAFDKHMRPYIALEEKNMDEQLQESRTDKAVDTRGELPVFTSSTALFLYIKNSITRCTALTKGVAFFLLYRAFQDALHKYAAVLGAKYPQPFSNAANSITAGLAIAGVSAATLAPAASSGPTTYRIPPGEEVTVCHVIDTCEYCAETIEALEELIREKIDAKYRPKVDMAREQEAFHDVSAKGLRVLVSGLATRTEGALKDLSNTNWGFYEDVGEESAYVRAVHEMVQPFVATVRELIPNSYFRNFCDKFAVAFTSSFFQNLIRLKKINDFGCQQLLLDVYNLKTLLLKLPVMEKANTGSGIGSGSATKSSTTIAPAMYTKMVTKEFSRIEILLKLVSAPADQLVEMFKAQWEDATVMELHLVMNLKGLKRSEQTPLVEAFQGGENVGPAKSAAATMTENFQARSSDFSAKVNADLTQMRQKVDDFRKAFR